MSCPYHPVPSVRYLFSYLLFSSILFHSLLPLRLILVLVHVLVLCKEGRISCQSICSMPTLSSCACAVLELMLARGLLGGGKGVENPYNICPFTRTLFALSPVFTLFTLFPLSSPVFILIQSIHRSIAAQVPYLTLSPPSLIYLLN